MVPQLVPWYVYQVVLEYVHVYQWYHWYVLYTCTYHAIAIPWYHGIAIASTWYAIFHTMEVNSNIEYCHT